MRTERRDATTPASSLCECGHSHSWHSHDGVGDCEHDGDCGCTAFATAAANEGLPEDGWTPYHEFRANTDPPPWGRGMDE